MATQKLRKGDKIKFQIGTGEWSVSHGTYLHPLEDANDGRNLKPSGGMSEMSMILTAVNRRMKIRTSDIWLDVRPPAEAA